MTELDGARRLIGRDGDVARLRALLDGGERLISVVGPGGIGKTRLARALVEEAMALGRCTRFFDLGAARDEAELCGVVADELSLTLRPGGGEPEHTVQVGRALRDLELVILDNFEQLVEHAGPLGTWMRLAPSTRFLITSRERLGIDEERVHELAPLSVPGHGAASRGSTSEQLWRSRVATMIDGYRVEDDDVSAVVEILRRLEGLPLAIELAAARRRILGSRELLRRVEESFDVLASRSRSGHRHGTLRACIESSWRQLTTHEQRTLAQCAVFVGGFDVPAAEHVVQLSDPTGPTVLELLQSLRDKSLLASSAGPTPTRLAMLDSVRELAVEALDGADREGACSRHAAYFGFALDDVRSHARVGSPAHIAALTSERANLTAACERAAAGEAPLAPALRALVSLGMVALFRGGHRRVVELASVLLARAAESATEPASLAGAYLARSSLLHQQSNMEGARADGFEALRRARACGDPATEVDALHLLGLVEIGMGHLEAAGALQREALAGAKQLGDRAREACVLIGLGATAQWRGELGDARELYTSAIDIATRDDYPRFRLIAAVNLAMVEGELGRHDRTRAACEEVLRLNRNDPRIEVSTRCALAGAATERGDHDEAMEQHRRALTIAEEHDTPSLVPVLRLAGVTCLVVGRASEAAQYFRRGLEHTPTASLERALLTAFLAVVDAEEGLLARAEERLVEAEHTTEGRVGWHAEVIKTQRAIVELAKSRDATGQREIAAARTTAAKGWLDEARGPAARSYSLRMALRMLEARLADHDARAELSDTTGALVVHESGEWFVVPSGARVELGRRRLLGRLLAALARDRIGARVGLAADDLIALAWPGERILPDAASTRLRVALTRLRGMGVGDLLESGSGRYRLSLAVPVKISG